MKRIHYRDLNTKQLKELNQYRNGAGQYLANKEFSKAFECLLAIRQYLKTNKLEVDMMFFNLLEEIIAIGIELSEDDSLILIGFKQYLEANQERLYKH